MPHIHDKIDFTVEVFIVHDNKVLLRKHDKYKIWLGVGGHIELNEDPIQTAKREVMEEVGLNIEIKDDLLKFKIKDDSYEELIPPKFLNRHRINKGHEHITFVYFATSDSDKVITSGNDKSEEWRWFSIEDINKFGDLRGNIMIYAEEALKQLGST